MRKILLVIFICTVNVVFAQTQPKPGTKPPDSTKTSTTKTPSKADTLSNLMKKFSSLLDKDSANLASRLDSPDVRDTDFVVQLKNDSLAPIIPDFLRKDKLTIDSLKKKRKEVLREYINFQCPSAALCLKTNKTLDSLKNKIDSLSIINSPDSLAIIAERKLRQVEDTAVFINKQLQILYKERKTALEKDSSSTQNAYKIDTALNKKLEVNTKKDSTNIFKALINTLPTTLGAAIYKRDSSLVKNLKNKLPDTKFYISADSILLHTLAITIANQKPDTILNDSLVLNMCLLKTKLKEADSLKNRGTNIVMTLKTSPALLSNDSLNKLKVVVNRLQNDSAKILGVMHIDTCQLHLIKKKVTGDSIDLFTPLPPTFGVSVYKRDSLLVKNLGSTKKLTTQSYISADSIIMTNTSIAAANKKNDTALNDTFVFSLFSLKTNPAQVSTYQPKVTKDSTDFFNALNSKVGIEVYKKDSSLVKNLNHKPNSLFYSTANSLIMANTVIPTANKKIDTTLNNSLVNDLFNRMAILNVIDSLKILFNKTTDSLKKYQLPSIYKFENDSLAILNRLDKISFKVLGVYFNYPPDGRIINMTIYAQQMVSGKRFQIFYNVPRMSRLLSPGDVLPIGNDSVTLPQYLYKNSHSLLRDILVIYPYYDKKAVSLTRNPKQNQPSKILSSSGKTYLFAQQPLSYFRVNIASDLLGLLGNNDPNGKIQLEFNAYFNLGRRRKAFCFLKNIDPTFAITKIGLTNAFIPLKFDSTTKKYDTVSTTEILQYTSLNVGARINIFSWNIGNKYTSFLYLNFIGRYYTTPFSAHDSIFSSNTFASALEVIANLYYSHNKIDFVPSMTFMDFHFLNTSIPQRDYVAVPIYHSSFKSIFSNLASDIVDCPQIMIYYSPTGDPNNRIFFKANYSFRGSESMDGFMQVQVGYTVDIRNFVKLFSPSTSSTNKNTSNTSPSQIKGAPTGEEHNN